MTEQCDKPHGNSPRRFPTTHWSLVQAAARTDSPESRAALASLCSAYWYPLYAFVRRSGHSKEDAQDLVQGFFARFLEKNYLRGRRQEAGRFRSYLLSALKHYLANEYDRSQTHKRGAGRQFLSLEVLQDGEWRYQSEPVTTARRCGARSRAGASAAWQSSPRPSTR